MSMKYAERTRLFCPRSGLDVGRHCDHKEGLCGRLARSPRVERAGTFSELDSSCPREPVGRNAALRQYSLVSMITLFAK